LTNCWLKRVQRASGYTLRYDQRGIAIRFGLSRRKSLAAVTLLKGYRQHFSKLIHKL
jgi:hypothetical protein